MDSRHKQYEKASKVLPGGVNSSVRYSRAHGVSIYMSRAEKGLIYDLDGREYVDMACAHGAGLLGNAHPAINRALDLAKETGFLNSFETVYHEELARKVVEPLPCADMARFTNSGTEATMHLIRLCRAFTGRNKIIRMEGHFHGYHEMIYIGGQPPFDVLPGNRKRPYIESVGIPEIFAQLIVPVPFNDSKAFDEAVREHGKDTAVVILEPINFNSGAIKPEGGYLEHIREVTRRENILLFFDEVQSAYKTNPGGAQKDFGVTPDVCTIGKSLGGGLPLSAFCGSEEIMSLVKPVGNVQHSGTFNAHLVNVLAGLAFIDEINKPYFYPALEKLNAFFYGGLEKIIKAHDLNMAVPYYGPRFNIIFGRRECALRYDELHVSKPEAMFEFVRETYSRGVYFQDYGGGPSHHGYSVQHTEADLAKVLNVMEDVLKGMKQKGLV